MNMPGNEAHNSLVACLCDAWEALDADQIEPLLAEDLHYWSWWLMKETHTKKEYMEYIRGRFKAMKNSGEFPIVKIGVNRLDGEYAVAIQQGDSLPALIRIIEKDGKIHDMWMQAAE